MTAFFISVMPLFFASEFSFVGMLLAAYVIVAITLYPLCYALGVVFRTKADRHLAQELLAVEDFDDGVGIVKAGETLWDAVSEDSLKAGEPVIVTGRDGISLIVKPVSLAVHSLS